MATDGLILIFASGKDGIHADEQAKLKMMLMSCIRISISDEKLALVSPTGIL